MIPMISPPGGQNGFLGRNIYLVPLSKGIKPRFPQASGLWSLGWQAIGVCSVTQFYAFMSCFSCWFNSLFLSSTKRG